MILINPFLYQDPLARIGKMLVYRSYEMNWQWEMFKEFRVPDGGARLPFMLQRVFERYAAFQFPFAFWLNILIYILGLAAMIWFAYRWFAWQEGSPAGPVLLVVGAWLALPMLATRIDWDRYYMFPVLLSTIVMAIGFQKVVSWSTAQWAKRQRLRKVVA
jgi:hypothetical protein